MTRFTLAIILVTLAGCASTNTGVVEISENTYMLGRQDWKESSGSVVKAQLYREGAAYCAARGKKFKPLGSTGQDYGSTWAGAEIQFTCV